jgi:tripartite-type tricarboxylate transporter receptor subunit TctC
MSSVPVAARAMRNGGLSRRPWLAGLLALVMPMAPAWSRAAPDGYTLLMGTIANATNMSMYRQLGYDTLRDFAPVTQVMSAPRVLVVAPSAAFGDLAGLILPDVREKLAAQGAEPVGSTPEQFRAYVRAEVDKWALVVRAAGVRAD